jgi:hypothetical protein
VHAALVEISSWTVAHLVWRVNDITREIAVFSRESSELDCPNVRVAARRLIAERWLMADG